jgi:peptidoglycan DL-endopeptidase CwlO
MSLAEVQARTAELQATLRALTGQGVAARGAVGRPAAGAPAATTTSFADALADARAEELPLAAERSGSRHWTRAGGGQRVTAAPSGQQVVDLARQHLGTPYVWGGEQPGGFDCSGLVQWAYAQVGVDLPRVSTDQARVGRAVSPEDARPGDLVFFERGKVDHIGLYAGDGRWVVAPKTGDVVKVEAVDLAKATTIRRVLPEGADPARPAALRTASGTAGPGSGWVAALPASGRRFADGIAEAAQAAGVDPRLLAAVAWSESGFDPRARSSAGAEGLMQLMPRTAAGLGVDALDPRQALDGGARYLAQQLRAFGGSEELALAAYNAGPTAVRRHGGVPPYAETQRYVTTVLDRFRALGGTA